MPTHRLQRVAQFFHDCRGSFETTYSVIDKSQNSLFRDKQTTDPFLRLIVKQLNTLLLLVSCCTEMHASEDCVSTIQPKKRCKCVCCPFLVVSCFFRVSARLVRDRLEPAASSNFFETLLLCSDAFGDTIKAPLRYFVAVYTGIRVHVHHARAIR